MTPLQRLETEVLTLQSRLSLRPALDLARAIGEKLTEAKKLLPHGEWLPWLKRCCIRPRTAQTYVQCANTPFPAHSDEHLSIEGFLRTIRLAKIAAKAKERDAARAEARARHGRLPDGIQIHHADCRKHEWPMVDMVATDPPWQDYGAYEWLAAFCDTNLVDGGFLLVQCGQIDLPVIFPIFKRLTYGWTLAMVYSQVNPLTASGRFCSTWKPMLLFSKGKGVFKERMSDTYSVSPHAKPLHVWEQPIGPWRHWIGKLGSPGRLVADPFMGSGTTGQAAIENGMKFVGTEIDLAHYEVVRGRLLG